MPGIRVQLSRVQRILLWATISAVLVLAMYPTTTLHYWDHQGGYHDIDPRTIQLKDRTWIREIGARRLIVSMPQWIETFDDGSFYFREEPHYKRMWLECGLVLVMGLGLVFALGNTGKRQR
jgi:hypothetical protein